MTPDLLAMSELIEAVGEYFAAVKNNTAIPELSIKKVKAQERIEDAIDRLQRAYKVAEAEQFKQRVQTRAT